MTALATVRMPIPDRAIRFLLQKRRRFNQALSRLNEGDVDCRTLLRAGITRQELERIRYEDIQILADRLVYQWEEYRALMRVCFDPVQVEQLFDTLD